jgi:hypothetical protein
VIERAIVPHSQHKFDEVYLPATIPVHDGERFLRKATTLQV